MATVLRSSARREAAGINVGVPAAKVESRNSRVAACIALIRVHSRLHRHLDTVGLTPQAQLMAASKPQKNRITPWNGLGKCIHVGEVF